MELGLGAGDEDSGGSSGMTKVSVAVRVRPLIEREKTADAQIHWQIGPQELQPYDPVLKRIVHNAQPYTYDHVFNQTTQTQQVYDTMVSPIVKKAFKGFNGTILCYGQTSSGKTHTLYGSNDDKGIILLFADHLYQHIKADESHRQYIIKVGLIEIYNEKVSDLLNSYNPIELQERDGSIVPHGLEEITVFDIDDWKKVTERVQRERKIGETRMNKESSRSHTILRVTIESFDLTTNTAFDDVQENPEQSPPLTTAVLHFVDLAGSEKQSQTGAEGERFKEQVNINMSLSVLSRVIKQLSEQASVTESHQGRTSTTEQSLAKAMCQSLIRNPPKSRFINFRDSKLTRLLQSSLNGEAFISMVCNVTIASLDETKSTLQFAKQAKKIQIRPKQNLCSTKLEYEKKLEELQELLNSKDKEVMVLRRQCENMKRTFEFRDEQNTQRAPNIDRRLSLCPTMFRSSADKTRHSNPEPMSMFSYYKNKYSSSGKMNSLGLEDGFMSAEDFVKTLRSPLKSIRESINSEVIRLDKEVQTESSDTGDEEGLRFPPLSTIRESPYEDSLLGQQVKIEQKELPATPERKLRRKRDPETPAPMLRLNNELLRTTNEEDRLEYEEMKTYLESEIATLREDVAGIPKLKSDIETLQFEKKELENDVMRQMQASRVEMTRLMAESPEVLALKSRLQAAEEAVVNKDTVIETITAELHSVKMHQDKGAEVEQQLQELQNTINKLVSANEDLEKKHRDQTELCEEQVRQLEEQRSLISSVTKQAEDHEHCQDLASKLKLAEEKIDKMVTNEVSLQQQLQAQQDALDQAESRVITEVSELRNRLQEAKEQVMEKGKHIEAVTTEFNTLKDQQERYQEQEPKLKELQSAIANQTQQIEEQRSTITSLSKLAEEHENCQALASKLRVAEEKIDKMVTNEVSLQQQLQAQQDALDQAESRVITEVSELRNRLQEAEEQVMEKGKHIEAVTTEFNTLKDRQERYQEFEPKLKELQSAIAKLMSTKENLEQEVKTQTQQIEEQRSTITSLSKLADEHENCQALASKLRVAEEQVDKMVANEAILQQQLKVQQDEYQKAESALQEMKLELSKVEDSKLIDLKNKIEAAEAQAAQKDELIQNITSELQSVKTELENYEEVESQLLDLETINMKLLSTNEELELKLENQVKVCEEQQCMITAVRREAEEHGNLAIKLRVAEDQVEELMGNQISLQAQLKAQQDEYKKAESRIEEMKVELTTAQESQLTDLKTKLLAAEEQILNKEKLFEMVTAELTNVKLEKSKYEELQQQQLKELENGNLKLTSFNEDLNEKLSIQTRICEEQTKQIDEQRSMLTSLQKLSEEHESCQNVKAELQAAEDKLDTLMAAKVAFDEQLNSMQNDYDKVELLAEKLRAELEAMAETLEMEKTKGNEHLQKLNKMVEEHGNCQQLYANLNIAQEEVQKLTADKLAVDEQLEVLRAAHDNAELVMQKMREELTVMKKETEIERRNAEDQIEKLNQVVIEHQKCQDLVENLKTVREEVENLATGKLGVDEQLKVLQAANDNAELAMQKMREELTVIKKETEFERRNAEDQIEKLNQIVVEHQKCQDLVENLKTARDQVDQLKAKKAALEAELKAQQDGFDKAEEKIHTEVMGLMNRVQVAEEQMAHKNRTIATITMELESIKAQHGRDDELESQLNELQSTNEQLISTNEDLQKKLTNQIEICTKHTRYIEDQRALIASMNKLAEEHEHCRDLGGRLKFAEDQVDKITKSKEVLQHQHLEAQQGLFARLKVAEDQAGKLLTTNVALQHQLKAYQDMTAKLNSAQDQVDRLMVEKVALEQELKSHQDVCEKVSRGVVVTRATQCSDLSTEIDHFRDASKHYRTRAHNAEFELERAKKALKDLESELHMLTIKKVPQEPATSKVVKVFDGQNVSMVNRGLQCTLLNELLQKGRETSLDGLPGIAQLQSDLKTAEVARDKLKHKLSQCNCNRKQLGFQSSEKPADTITTKYKIPSGFQRKVAFFQGGSSTIMNMKESVAQTINQPSGPKAISIRPDEINQETKPTSFPAPPNDPENIENAPEQVSSANAVQPVEEQSEDDGFNWLLQLVQKKT